MKAVSRLLLLAGAAGVVLSVFLPWVTLEGALLDLHLDLLGTGISPTSRTVSGTETTAFPVVAGVGALVGVLAVFNLARRLLLLLGLLVVLAGGGLLYYVLNVVDIETAGRSTLEQAAAGAAVTSTAGAGPFLLLASGVCILVGALRR